MKYQVEIDNISLDLHTIEAYSCEWDEWFVKFRNDKGRIVAMFAIRTVLSVMEVNQ